MGKILFIDDEKLPEWFGLDADTPHAKNIWDGLKTYNQDGEIDTLYLDHDLGTSMMDDIPDGSKLLNYICETSRKPKVVYCISINPVGVERIKWVCKDHNIPFQDIGRKIMFDKFTILGGQSG